MAGTVDIFSPARQSRLRHASLALVAQCNRGGGSVRTPAHSRGSPARLAHCQNPMRSRQEAFRRLSAQNRLRAHCCPRLYVARCAGTRKPRKSNRFGKSWFFRHSDHTILITYWKRPRTIFKFRLKPPARYGVGQHVAQTEIASGRALQSRRRKS